MDTCKFKVGDKVKVLDKLTILPSQRPFLDKTVVIVKAKLQFGSDDEIMYLIENCTLPFYESELELVNEEKLMNYKEALKAAIDGHKVTQGQYCKPWYIFCDNNSKFKVFNINKTSDLSSWDSNEFHLKTNWTIYEEPVKPPKYAINQLVYTSKGKIAVVTKVSQKDGTNVYTLSFNRLKPKIVSEYTEEQIGGVV